MGQKSSSGKFDGIDTNKRACVYEYHVTSRVSAIGKLGAVTEHRCEISGWSAKSLKMWWPGTELNRRRQPFQGCALPPELPGHFFSASLRAEVRPHHSAGCTLFLGGEAAKRDRFAESMRNLRIIT